MVFRFGCDQSRWLPEHDQVTPVRMFGLLASYAGLWLLLTPYAGMSHDAQAYAFQALARSDASILGQDLFLRFDSQDRFTIFPAIYAALIDAFGLERTAAVLTFALHGLWLGASWLLCRRLMGAPVALLALGLLIAIPGPYGGHRVFHIAEPFLTARLPAEVMALLSVAAYFAGRRVLAGLLLGAGLLIHPLMAFPALLLVALIWISDVARRPQAVPLAAMTIFVGAVAGSAVVGGHAASMDPEWLATARSRSGFLFPGSWRIADWNHTLLSLLTLALAALVLPQGSARTLGRCAFWLGVAGLALAIFAGELWNLKLLLQGQPWRWLWLVRWSAIALLPAIVLAAWQDGTSGRATALLLSAAWAVVLPVSAQGPMVVMLGALLAASAVAVWSVRNRIPPSTQSLLLRGSALVLGLAIVGMMVTALLVGSVLRADSALSPLMQRVQGVSALITPGIIFVVGAWTGFVAQRRAAPALLMALATTAVLVVATPPAVKGWMARKYDADNQARFAEWRARIPADAEVFWWDGLREIWFLLHRRSYLTISQGGGVVFSEETAREFRRRADSLGAFIDPGFWMREPDALAERPRPVTAALLASICRDPDLGFVVATDDLGTGAPRVEWPQPGRFVYLYDCTRFRSAGAQ